MPKSLLLAISLVLCAAALARAQEERPRTVGGRGQPAGSPVVPAAPEEVVRIRTRVVFIDALVKDAKTREPVRDLAAENFRVLDEGRPRALSYFTR